MKHTLAFDAYGTLIDTQGVIQALQEVIGDRVGAFSQVWRAKQLEYSFRRGLMGSYQNFSVCTAPALDYNVWRSAAVQSLLANAGIRDFFEGVVSCDDVQTFKPNPVVYDHFIAETGSDPQSTWLISSNPFDVIGAVSAGWKSAWIRRPDAAIFDPWEFAPTTVVTSLGQLTEKLML